MAIIVGGAAMMVSAGGMYLENTNFTHLESKSFTNLYSINFTLLHGGCTWKVLVYWGGGYLVSEHFPDVQFSWKLSTIQKWSLPARYDTVTWCRYLRVLALDRAGGEEESCWPHTVTRGQGQGDAAGGVESSNRSYHLIRWCFRWCTK